MKMKIKVFTPNERGKIEFTREELERLLNEVYNDGFRDGEVAQREKSTWTWTPPYVYNSDLGTTTTSSTNMPLTINANTTQPIDNLTCTYDSTANKNDASIAKGVSINGTNPFTITMKIPEGDVKKATEQLANLVTNQNGLAARDVVDVFSNLAKELNF
jgi:hypothetical protein